MEKIKPQRTDRGSTNHYSFEKLIGQSMPTVEEIIAETGMSRANARREYKRLKEKHRPEPGMPSPFDYANAYDSWSMD